jgi:dihydrofolate synthase/folylpolyglutamate synthase
VSGTSGKGSTSYLLSHILTTSGYSVGFTLSPHLQKINERIQIRNKPISDSEFIRAVNKVIPVIDQMAQEPIGKPSYFEIILATALQYFADKKIDILIAEVGLEGKYDGTNVLNPLLAVLTNISLDHTRILGDTVEKIAEEATSIIKGEGISVITGVTQESVIEIVKKKAKMCSAQLILIDSNTLSNIECTKSGSTFTLRNSKRKISKLFLRLVGSYQLLNCAIAVESILALEASHFNVSDNHIKQALRTAQFPGRFEIISPIKNKYPEIILDGAHNTAKMKAFLDDLAYLYPKVRKVFHLLQVISILIIDSLLSIMQSYLIVTHPLPNS